MGRKWEEESEGESERGESGRKRVRGRVRWEKVGGRE